MAAQKLFECLSCARPRKDSCACTKCDHVTQYRGNICTQCCAHKPCSRCSKCPPPYGDMSLEERRRLHVCECDQCASCYGSIHDQGECDCCHAPHVRSNRNRATTVLRLCKECCRHRCCEEAANQINRPVVFWVPTAAAAKAEFPYDSVNSITSELILGGQLGSGRLNMNLFREHPHRRFASVELEVSNARSCKRLNELCTLWSCSVVHDGSINRDMIGAAGQGFEINSSPACGGAFTAQLKDLTQALAAAKAQVNHTCGLHVHVDARDFGYQDIQRLLRVYVLIEDALFAAVNPDRRNNRYCLKCGPAYAAEILDGIKPDTKSVKEAVVSATYGKDSLTRRGTPIFHQWRDTHRGRGDGRDPDHMARYYAFNIHTWFRQGTIESRLHQGTLDYDEIYGWARLHVDFVDSVAKASDAEIKAIVSSAVESQDTHGIRTGRVAANLSIGRGLTVVERLLPPHNLEYLRNKILAQLQKGEPAAATS